MPCHVGIDFSQKWMFFGIVRTHLKSIGPHAVFRRAFALLSIVRWRFGNGSVRSSGATWNFHGNGVAVVYIAIRGHFLCAGSKDRATQQMLGFATYLGLHGAGDGAQLLNAVAIWTSGGKIKHEMAADVLRINDSEIALRGPREWSATLTFRHELVVLGKFNWNAGAARARNYHLIRITGRLLICAQCGR